jgi:3-methylcrotonyl-CoA carboxylase alpha subunit
MFDKILIANRGEIACRVIVTARRMGIATVAVYSDADAKARHVAMADEAVHIGPAPATESYLQADKIIAAAKATGANAIHPGYGFLSENPDFAEAVETAGLVFIGPPAAAIRAMGLKDAAKLAMEKAGVPVVPGYHGGNQDADFLAAEADRIGYPVLIKARAGGGGKGMRLVEAPKEFAAALEGAQREAEASFGDPACLIEKFITRPRHIEIQIFGDSHGNAVHLFERDCSLQRRHQKVIEEAPAPGMTEEVREAMCRAAVDAAKAIGYQGAGTVEFIADGSDGLHADRFWFMEMNTRLQVEHPVTEAITGLDLVELQLRAAAGEPLPFAQGDLRINGHAFEARIYAEDVPKGFLPATGVLDYLSFPAASEFEFSSIRIDSGLREGDEISPFYDPMIAKLIVHGSDRTEALNRLSVALGECHIAGTTTNLAFLGALARHEGFARGEVDTGLIGRDIDILMNNDPPGEEVSALAALARLGLHQRSGGADPWDKLKGWRHWSEAEDYVELEFDGASLERKIVTLGYDRYRIEGGDQPLEIAIIDPEGIRIRFSSQSVQRDAVVFHKNSTITVFFDGQSFAYRVLDPLDGSGDVEAGGDVIASPMPGQVKRVRAKAGQMVAKGDALIILEAMKMEHTLTAPRDGKIAEIFAAEGEQVTGGALLLKLESAAD